VVLAKDHLALGPLNRPPGANALLDGAPYIRSDLWVTALHLLENRHRPQSRRRLQHRDDLAVPNRGQGIGPASAARCSLLRRQSAVFFKPVSGGGREAGFGRRNRRRVDLTLFHVNPHLVVGDVTARQRIGPPKREDQSVDRPAATARGGLLGRNAVGA
jgi:hypothetical protein